MRQQVQEPCPPPPPRDRLLPRPPAARRPPQVQARPGTHAEEAARPTAEAGY